MSKIIKYASHSLMSAIESGIILYKYSYINSINNHAFLITILIQNKFMYMYITMNNLAANLVNHNNDYSIGDERIWESRLKHVIDDITYFNADVVVCDSFCR